MEDVDVDDDFGDLYADVEAQASSAINCLANLAPFRNYSVSDEQLKQKDKVDEAVSDSEDDLNIVSNDKDCKSKSFGVLIDEDYMDNDYNDGFEAINDVKCVKTSASPSPTDSNAKLSIEKHQTLNGQCKGPVAGQSSLVGPTRNFGTSERRFGFTLPWNRSILDVNIDTFEEKLWRYPGIDIRDFFNFGFDEDTWKQYCNSVDQYRFSGSMALGNTNQVYGSQLEETVVDVAHQPKGRAIQVEDGDSERQPTVDIRCQRDRDSDVVIQINLEGTSDISEKPDSRGRDAMCEASDNGDLGCEFSLGSVKENDEKASSVTRSLEKTASSNSMTDNVLDEVEKNKIHCIGHENRHKSSFSSDGTHELIEPIKNSMKSNIVSNVCSVSDVETESLFEEEGGGGEEVGQLSLSSSLFESDSEDSRYSSDLYSRTITSPLCRSLEVLKGKNSKINLVDSRDFSRRKIPVRDNPRQWVSSVRWKEKYRNIGHSEEFDYLDSWIGRESTQNHFDRERDSYQRKNSKLRRHVREYESFSRHSYTRQEMDSRSNRNNHNHKLQFQKSVNRDTRLLDHNRCDSGFGRERFGRVTCDRSYERLRFEGSGRKRYENLYPLEDEYFVNHQLHRDSDRFKDEYSENMDALYPSSHYYQKCEEDSTLFDRDTMRPLSLCASHDDSFSYSFRFKRKRGCFRRSEVLPWTEKDATFKRRTENFDVFENRRHRRDYSTFESLDMKSNQLSYEVIRDESKKRGSVYRSGKNFRGNKGLAFVRSRDSGDLGSKKEKDSMIRCHKGRISRLDIEDEDSKVSLFMGQSKNEDLDIEDGQIISKCDTNQRILKSMAKMEKRRERFKEPITRLFKKEEVKCSNSEIVVPFTVQHRPVRKRQWCVR